MAAPTTAANVWNCPNYLGDLIVTASPTDAPLLAMSGGLNGVKTTSNFVFPIDQEYTQTAASQPAITETASLTKPTAISLVRTPVVNTCGIVHESVSISYAKLSNFGKLDSTSTNALTSGGVAVPRDEKAFQIAGALEKIQRDTEYTIIQGAYVAHTAVGTASKTRGLSAAIVEGGTVVAAAGATLTKTMIDTLLRNMYTAGAKFKNPIFVANAFQKQMLSHIYAYAPTDRNVGGVNIKQIETDFGIIGVLLDPFQVTSVLGLYDMAFVSIVTCPVPGKGNMFYEELSKTGAAEEGQIYGQIGLDHGPEFMHGHVSGLATS
jgi:hypothetical protein